jgi:DNA repair protein RecN (Recombination protein N)
MLSELVVQNLVIVDRARLTPGTGLTVVSGETGAGKSLLLDALALLLGGRANQRLVGPRGDEANVSGVFQVLPELAERIETGCGVAAQDGTYILRRRLTAAGRSQAWINDVPVTVATLQAAAAMLVEIRAQHEALSLADPVRQLALLDGFAGTKEMAESYRTVHARCQSLMQELSTLEHGQRDSLKELDFLRFQSREFQALAPRAGELAEIERRQALLSGAEEWRTRAAEAADALGEGERAVVRVLEQFARILSRAPDQRLAEAGEACTQAAELVRDASLTCLDLAERLGGDPSELARVEERRDAYYQLMRKHGDGEDFLLAAWTAIDQRIAELEGLDGRRERLRADLSESQRERARLGKRLAKERAVAFGRLAGELAVHLAELGMPKTKLSLSQDELSEPGPQGTVRQEMLVATNPGLPPGRLGEIASGGEAARLSLALAVVLAEHDRIPVLVFDEVDSGVGGRLGTVIGAKLASLGRDRTVIAVTHTPQVAAMAHRHYAVRKLQGDDETMVQVTEIAGDKRVAEIAEMLGGGKAALGQAKTMMGKPA